MLTAPGRTERFAGHFVAKWRFNSHSVLCQNASIPHGRRTTLWRWFYAPVSKKVSTRQAFILSIGSDAELLGLRSEVLRVEGYAVRQESDLGHALITFKDGDFDLIVICHSVPEKDRLRIVANAKRIKPSTLVLLVTTDTYGEAARLM